MCGRKNLIHPNIITFALTQKPTLITLPEAIEDCSALKEEIQEIRNEEEEHEEQFVNHMKEQALAHEVVKRKLGENRMQKTRQQITEEVSEFRAAGAEKKQGITKDVQKARWQVCRVGWGFGEFWVDILGIITRIKRCNF